MRNDARPALERWMRQQRMKPYMNHASQEPTSLWQGHFNGAVHQAEMGVRWGAERSSSAYAVVGYYLSGAFNCR